MPTTLIILPIVLKSQTYFTVIDAVLTCLLAIVSGLSQINPKDYGSPYRQHLELLNEYAIQVIIILAVGIAVSKISAGFLVKRTVSRQQIKAVLDSLDEVFFAEVESEERFKNRVTLFKVTKNFLTRQKSLKIFSRAGDNYQDSTTEFLIDDSQEDVNEGIAGRAWFLNSRISAELPPWPDQVNTRTKRDCEAYANEGGLDIEKASKLAIKSRSITATVVRNQKGHRWGVLVLDSRDPQGVPDKTEKNQLIDMVAKTLSFTVR